MSDITLCNVCGRPLAVKEEWLEKSIWNGDDFEDGWYEHTVSHRTKEWNTRDLFPNLCESCACCIDRALRKMKTGMIEREKVLARFKELNEERKKRLGTKG